MSAKYLILFKIKKKSVPYGTVVGSLRYGSRDSY